MKVDKELMQKIAQQAAVTTAISGGVAQSDFEISRTSEGLLLKLNTPSLDENAYHVRVTKGNLMLFTMYKSSVADAADEEEDMGGQPTFVHQYPLSPKINQERIEAIFDQGELRVYLPFLDDNTGTRDIDIQRYRG
ncbi:MAG: hypothetical protein ACPGJS_13360 [Flammeovirgaceae bacterium]